MTTVDVAIIGAGPTGLFAVFQCGMQKLRCAVIDALDVVGGQCQALYPEKPIYDIPAWPEISGGDLAAKLKQQAAPFAPEYFLGQTVTGLKEHAGEWHLTTSTGNSITAKAVIIAAGAGAFGPNRPPIEGIEAFEKTGAVQYFVAKREDFRGKRLLIAGGGDSAVDWAVNLAPLAKKIYVLHRRAKFRAAPEMAAQLEALSTDGSGRVELVVPYQLHALQGQGGALASITVSSLTGETRTLEVDNLLAFFGLSMDLGAIASWGLNLDHNHITINPATGATSVPGIYAVGDIATYPHKLKLIATGFAEAAQAAHAIYNYLYPDQPRHFQYSTSTGVPAA